MKVVCSSIGALRTGAACSWFRCRCQYGLTNGSQVGAHSLHWWHGVRLRWPLVQINYDGVWMGSGWSFLTLPDNFVGPSLRPVVWVVRESPWNVTLTEETLKGSSSHGKGGGWMGWHLHCFFFLLTTAIFTHTVLQTVYIVRYALHGVLHFVSYYKYFLKDFVWSKMPGFVYPSIRISIQYPQIILYSWMFMCTTAATEWILF